MGAGSAVLGGRRRVVGVDVLRGGVVALMALDHARDFLGMTPYAPTDLDQASAGLFLTRWVTHFCAPVFVLLAGVSAGLRLGARETAVGRRDARRELAWFLLTRGVWLIVLELTVVRAGWFVGFLADYTWSRFIVQVIWALGVSMVVLAPLVLLPRWCAAVFGVVLVCGHNALDGVDPGGLGWFEGVFRVLHVADDLSRPETWVELPWGARMGVVYPVLPWPGVMALGFACAGWLRSAGGARRMAAAGVLMMAGFVVVRAAGVYGEPVAWAGGGARAVLEFVNTTKYPPSLAFLLMTLGPAVAVLGVLSLREARGRLARVLVVYGRAAMFFYVVHLFVLQGMGIAYALTRYGSRLLESEALGPPDDYYIGLAPVYAGWAAALAVMHPACAWWGRVKARGRGWWWSYV